MQVCKGDVLTLVLKSTFFVAGEDIQGQVRVDLQALQKTPMREVHVKLRGTLFTKIVKYNQHGTSHSVERVPLVRDTISVWKRGSVYPHSHTNTLELPFRFCLPAQLPPSCRHANGPIVGTVAYFVEIVGTRSGLRSNKRILCPIAVVPNDPTGAHLGQQLQTSVASKFSYTFTKTIHEGLSDDATIVTAILSLPIQAQIPIFTIIPFEINIATLSKSISRHGIYDERGLELPRLPLDPQEIELQLVQIVTVQSTEIESPAGYVGGFNPTSSKTPSIVNVETLHRTWVPQSLQEDEDGKGLGGMWRQEVTFRSSMYLTCPPTFDLDLMSISYRLLLRVPFPGFGNDLHGELPLSLVSSMRPGWRDTFDGAVPQLDLPPTYLAVHHGPDARRWARNFD